MRISDWSSDVCSSEVVVLDPRECQREARVGMAVGKVRIDVQEAGRAFPHAPCARRGKPRGFVIAGQAAVECGDQVVARSEEHTSELQSLMRISYAVFSLKKKNQQIQLTH